jgi:hypothetical protein
MKLELKYFLVIYFIHGCLNIIMQSNNRFLFYNFIRDLYIGCKGDMGGEIYCISLWTHKESLILWKISWIMTKQLRLKIVVK